MATRHRVPVSEQQRGIAMAISACSADLLSLIDRQKTFPLRSFLTVTLGSFFFCFF